MLNVVKCKTLETERLILRQFTIDDAQNMYENWASDELAVKEMPWNIHKSISETEQILENWIESYNNDNFYKWAIFSKVDNELIGDISVVKMSLNSENCEVGYIIGSEWWNKGYMTEALKMVIDFLINEVGFHLIYALHDVKNPASGRVMEKAGMKYEATMREKHKRKDGTFADLNYYSITKEDKDEKF